MTTEFDDTSSIQEVPTKAMDNYVKSQEIELFFHPSHPNTVQMTVAKIWDDEEPRSVNINLSYDDMWEHIHNCLHAMNALKEGK